MDNKLIEMLKVLGDLITDLSDTLHNEQSFPAKTSQTSWGKNEMVK